MTRRVAIIYIAMQFILLAIRRCQPINISSILVNQSSYEFVKGSGNNIFVIKDNTKHRISLKLLKRIGYEHKVHQVPDNEIISAEHGGFVFDDFNEFPPIPILSRIQSSTNESIRWRENNYISEDGILPFQRCNSNEFYPGASKLTSTFLHQNISYRMIISSASVWGKSDAVTGKPINVDNIELLAYFQKEGKPCNFRCTQCDQCSTTVLDIPMNVSCSIGHVLVSAKLRPIYQWRAPFYYSIECEINKVWEKVEDLFVDSFNVTLYFKGDEITEQIIDMCYIHVAKPETVHICTQPQYGFEKTDDKFWFGDPRFIGYNMIDQFLLYHTKLMEASVTFSSLFGLTNESMKLFSSYRGSNNIFIRDRWKFDDLFPNNPNHIQYLFESLEETSCIYENRLRSTWIMIVHAADNFVYPLEFNQTLRGILQNVDRNEMAYALVPIILPGSIVPPTRSKNILQRYSVLQLGLWEEWKTCRHTPVGNPRRIQHSWVHFINLYPRFCVPKCYNFVYTVEKSTTILKLTTVHIMGITRPKLNRPNGTKYPWYTELSNRLNYELDVFLESKIRVV